MERIAKKVTDLDKYYYNKCIAHGGIMVDEKKSMYFINGPEFPRGRLRRLLAHGLIAPDKNVMFPGAPVQQYLPVIR